jgi:hypothetical protein
VPGILEVFPRHNAAPSQVWVGPMTDSPSTYLQCCLDRLQAGDETARKELLNGACERLSRLTRTMLKDYRRLKRWACLKLHEALHGELPGT